MGSVEVSIASVKQLAGDFVGLVREALSQRIAGEPLRMAIPGGSAAEGLLPALADAALDWQRFEIFFADERCVPEDDKDSNYALARRLWFEPARIPEKNIRRACAELGDAESAAKEYEALLRQTGAAPLDLALLGVGPDGHIASLFPGHALLTEADRWVGAISDAPKPPPRRLTLTLPLLSRAGLVVIAAFGESKAEVIAEALGAEECTLPLAQLLRRAPRSHLLLDEAAASQLRP